MRSQALCKPRKTLRVSRCHACRDFPNIQCARIHAHGKVRIFRVKIFNLSTAAHMQISTNPNRKFTDTVLQPVSLSALKVNLVSGRLTGSKPGKTACESFRINSPSGGNPLFLFKLESKASVKQAPVKRNDKVLRQI